MNVKVTGFNELEAELRNLINNKVIDIVADEYLDIIVDNLDESSKTGTLKNSFKIRNSRLKSTISSDVDYAAIQNYGGRIRITETMRKKMWVLYKKYGLGVYKAIAITKKNYINIPAKNYIDISNDRRKLERNIDRKLNKLTKRI